MKAPRAYRAEWIRAECAESLQYVKDSDRLLDATGEPDARRIAALAYKRAKYDLRHAPRGTLADRYQANRRVLLNRVPYQQHLYQHGLYP